MARYMVIGEMTGQGVQGLFDQGFASRHAQFVEMIGEQGGTVEGYWFNEQGQSVVQWRQDGPWNRTVAKLMTIASGAWHVVQTMELFDADELDAQLGATPGYQAPGRS